VNIDKFQRAPRRITKCARRCGVEREVILKGGFLPDGLEAAMGDQWSRVAGGTFLYMPIIWIDRLDGKAGFEAWQNSDNPPFAYELCFADEEPSGVLARLASMQSGNGSRIWLNTLWDSLCAGHTDERGLAGDPDGSCGWCTGHGATINTERQPRRADGVPSLSRQEIAPDLKKTAAASPRWKRPRGAPWRMRA